MNQLKVTGTQKIGEHEFTGIEGGFGEGKKAMLVKDIAEIHGQSVGNVNLLINRNRKRFKDGIDILDLKSAMGLSHSEIKDFGFSQNDLALVLSNSGFSQNQINATKNIYLLSERGYAKLLKILEDDKAWEIYDELVDGYFNMRQTIKQERLSNPQDDYAKQLRAKAMDQNSRNRAAEKLIALANGATSEVNKALLQNKAVEVLTGEKLLQMPTLREKMYTAEEIAKKLGVLSKSGNPHETAVSQLIQTQLILMDDEIEIFPESKGNWSGTVTKYSETVIEAVGEWLEENNYPSIIVGQGKKNYHVRYRNIE